MTLLELDQLLKGPSSMYSHIMRAQRKNSERAQFKSKRYSFSVSTPCQSYFTYGPSHHTLTLSEHFKLLYPLAISKYSVNIFKWKQSIFSSGTRDESF